MTFNPCLSSDHVSGKWLPVGRIHGLCPLLQQPSPTRLHLLHILGEDRQSWTTAKRKPVHRQVIYKGIARFQQETKRSQTPRVWGIPRRPHEGGEWPKFSMLAT